MSRILSVARHRCAALAASSLLTCGLGCAPLGRVPPRLVDLYDQALPTGTIEIELERDGAVREMEADIVPSAVPQSLRDRALELAGGGAVTGAEREFTRRGPAYEVKVVASGRAYEFVFDAQGQLLESEKEIRPAEAPAAVMEAADRALAGGSLKSVELVERGATQEYHVKKMKDGASYKIVVAPDGRLLRRVREQRAEIEIPLPD